MTYLQRLEDHARKYATQTRESCANLRALYHRLYSAQGMESREFEKEASQRELRAAEAAYDTAMQREELALAKVLRYKQRKGLT